LESLSGEDIHLNDLRGHVVLINFWATWCGPCRVEMPLIEDRYQIYRSDLVVLAVNFDESHEDVQAYVKSQGLNFVVLLDPGAKVQGLYQIRGYPTTFILDETGIVKVQHIGVMTHSQLDGYLEKVGLVQ
jgi:thiol-disulfide isomerase/thioredoxin